MGALLDLPVHQAPKARLVQLAVFEGRHQGGIGAPESRRASHGASPDLSQFSRAACEPQPLIWPRDRVRPLEASPVVDSVRQCRSASAVWNGLVTRRKATLVLLCT